MTKVLNETDALNFILTQHGLNRVTEALENPNVTLNISKIKVGDANFEYYEPTENQPDLIHPINGGEFYIIEKELLEDNLTVSFHAVIPETFQNVEIREVGIYETIDNVDYLFAVSTQQPLLKPLIDLNYLISVDYYAFLKVQNLSEIYDQIILNPDNQMVTEKNLENLMSTILFTENNLMNQINGNTKIIGLNRAQQLYLNILENRKNFGYYSIETNYSSLLSSLNNENEIFSYWVFNYPNRTSSNASVVDIGPQNRNLSTNANINLYPCVYNGVTPMLTFDSSSYFLLNSSLSFLNEEGTDDISFSIGFTVSPLSLDTDRTILAQSDYTSSNPINVFEITEKTNGSFQIKLFTDSSNYLTFTSGEKVIPSTPHSLFFSYNTESKTVEAYLNGDNISITKTITGSYTHMNPSTSIPTSSYITSSSGAIINGINSTIGTITVVKSLLNAEKLRALSLNLSASIGNNPCIKKS